MTPSDGFHLVDDRFALGVAGGSIANLIFCLDILKNRGNHHNFNDFIGGQAARIGDL